MRQRLPRIFAIYSALVLAAKKKKKKKCEKEKPIEGAVSRADKSFRKWTDLVCRSRADSHGQKTPKP